jgi:uncharacterized protein
MRIVISGVSGFLGRALAEHFNAQGHHVISLSRKHFKWNIHDFKELFREADVLIHLSGAPIFKRWTYWYKKELYRSRIETTQKIISALKLIKERPNIIVAASAVGIYNYEGEHTESSNDFGPGFISKLVIEWENALNQANELVGVRLIIARLGVVLSQTAPAYKKMLGPVKYWLGGRISTGKQGFSFIHLEDLIRAVDFMIANPSVRGNYNLCAPMPSTNKEFTALLAKAHRRTSFMVIPRFLLRMLYGRRADMLIYGQKVIPERLTLAGFQFLYPDAASVIHSLHLKK